MAGNTMEWRILDTREPVGPGTILMDGWELKELIGQGGFGNVWLAEKNLLGIRDQSVIKIIRIPHDPAEIDAMRAEGFSHSSIQAEFRRNVENAVREVRAMIDLRSHPAIVPCESFDVIQYEEDGTWEIDIRMQRLNPLINWTASGKVTTKDVIRMGISLSDLLAVCEENNILHRDIKPANIFVDRMNNFKLGDFGLARVISDTGSVHSKGVGTEAFMAPEVFRSGKYDHRADLYSLGLVMYWMLNNQSLPFTNEGISRGQAIARRLSGEALPPLPGVDPELDRIIGKACDPDPDKRWETAAEFRNALQNPTTQAQPAYSQPASAKHDPAPGKESQPAPAEPASAPIKEIEPMPAESASVPVKEVQPIPSEPVPVPDKEAVSTSAQSVPVKEVQPVRSEHVPAPDKETAPTFAQPAPVKEVQPAPSEPVPAPEKESSFTPSQPVHVPAKQETSVQSSEKPEKKGSKAILAVIAAVILLAGGWLIFGKQLTDRKAETTGITAAEVAGKTAEESATKASEEKKSGLQLKKTASAKGFGGDITVTVTFDETDAIAELSIDASNETSGMGQRAMEKEFTDQFIGKKLPLAMGQDIDAISGCTITSKAVVEAINSISEHDAQLPADGLVKVGIIHLDPDESYYREANLKDLQDTFTKGNGYDAVFVNASTLSEQLNETSNFIANGMKYILISTRDPDGWDNILKKAKDNDVHVFFYDYKVNASPDLYTAAVIADMAEEGETAVNWLLAQNLSEYNVIHIQGIMDSEAQIGRSGALDAQFKAGTMVKVAQQAASWDEEEAKGIVEAVIRSGKSFNVIYAESDGMARGAVDALDQYGITHGVNGDVVVMSFDCSKWALKKLLTGEWNYDGQISPFQAESIDALIRKIENGESIAQYLNELNQYFIPEYGFDARTITQEDVDKYGLGD